MKTEPTAARGTKICGLSESLDCESDSGVSGLFVG